MKQKIKLQTEKEIEFPARMFTEKDLSEMEIDSVKGKIFFNKIDKNNPFKKITAKVKKDMAILNYRDYSQTKFSETLLLENIKEQAESDESDFIILPHFKEENDFDVKIKIQIAGKIKKNPKIKKPVILEISHKCGIVHRELARLSDNFDFLSIFYGVYYGRYSTLTRISDRIVTFKFMTGKNVFCMGVPLKFEGEDIKDCRFMPCFILMTDAWVRNWKPARSSKDIKLTDKDDLKSKTYESWLENHGANQIIEPVKLTIKELFDPKHEKVRKEYEKLLYDETFLEVGSLDPSNIEKYISKKFANKYFVKILLPYSEKIIQQKFRNNDLFTDYSLQERLILEQKIRENQFSPSFVDGSINAIINKIRAEKNPPIMELVNTIEDFKVA